MCECVLCMQLCERGMHARDIHLSYIIHWMKSSIKSLTSSSSFLKQKLMLILVIGMYYSTNFSALVLVH